MLPFGLLVFLAAAAQKAAAEVEKFHVYSDAIHLRPGEVHNTYVRPKGLPEEVTKRFANKFMHLKSMQLDIVRLDKMTSEEVRLPLYDVYNHHHALIVGEANALDRIYNYTRGSDPLNPHHRGPHGHKGCSMMKGASFKTLLTEIDTALGPQGRGKVAAFGGASGAEFRGTSTGLAAPYTYTVWNPESFMVLMHFINTRGVPHEKKLWECPCTAARKIDLANGTIDGVKPIPFRCSAQLVQEANTACSLATYQGGYRCCEHGVYLTEDLPDPKLPADPIHAKFTFEYYSEDAPELAAGPIQTLSPACCDATSVGVGETSASSKAGRFRQGNLEYDVPQCLPGTPPEQCEYVISSIEYFDMPLGMNSSEYDPDEELDLVHAWGHQHVAGLGLQMFKESTGELLCHTRPKYGNGADAGNEAGFVVGIPPCVWGPPPLAPPPRLRRRDLLRTVARYNSTEKHHGVMSLWILTAPVKKHLSDIVV